MSASETALLTAVLALPERQRVAFAEALLSSLPDDLPELDDDALEAELVRRSEDADPSAWIPWSEVKKMTTKE